MPSPSTLPPLVSFDRSDSTETLDLWSELNERLCIQPPALAELVFRQAQQAKEAGAPDGRLYHVASPSGQGWFVVDVWESQEKLGKFAQVLMPLLAAAGVAPPTPKVYSVHNIIKG